MDEGSNSAARNWKISLYYIALQAQVPSVMAFMDYLRKLNCLGPLFYPTGDIEYDMVAIKAFYAPFKCKTLTSFKHHLKDDSR